jgi:hypothetical protein
MFEVKTSFCKYPDWDTFFTLFLAVHRFKDDKPDSNGKPTRSVSGCGLLVDSGAVVTYIMLLLFSI